MEKQELKWIGYQMTKGRQGRRDCSGTLVTGTCIWKKADQKNSKVIK